MSEILGPRTDPDITERMFHPVVESWFTKRFGSPTLVQTLAWPVIASGQDALCTAPTGSGKTLAAFLACLDRLTRQAIAGTLEDRTQIVYVSPLKALSNDVKRNLEEPLAGIIAEAQAAGLPAPPLRVAVRTGDTTMAERRAVVKRPPHILVTTPESLFILLTSESGRRGLRDARTVIVDEIHAVAPDKRGAHLALSLERLAQLVGGNLQRIGLSATVKPMEVAARLLVGSSRPAPIFIDGTVARDIDLKIEVLDDEIGAVCTNEQWAEIYDRVAALAREHRSTLVFVNTRRLVERMALHLGERLGENAVAAHHGSLSRARRFEAERRLKAGELKLVVATASLELGIDVGAVDLTCLIGSPRAISTGLQRIGRSGHAVGGTPKGRLFPLTRDQLVECAALVRGARKGELDAIALRDAPLDILAQQIVAAAAIEEWDEDALYDLCVRAAPYANLARSDFDAVVDMMSEGIATSRGRSGALLHRDAVNRRLRGRRGARLAALTSGGAIPDNALFEVVVEPEGTLIGTIEEDFAIESMAGDVFLLGNTSWRIRRVEQGRVRVEDAAGAAPTIPFWLGEAPARSRELSAEVGSLRDEVAGRIDRDDPEAILAWLMQACALDRAGATLVRDYIKAGRAALGVVPTTSHVVAERFFDEAGGTQVVIHAPFGGRINRAWGMALRKKFCRTFDFELQAAATDDGILLSLGPQHSFPLETIFELVRPDDIEEVLTQAALQAPMFETRWRWNLTRSLALLRHRGGKRVPPALQRMRAQDLLAAAFPGQVACQDNHGGGPIVVPDHPLVRETVRDCLTEPMDAVGLHRTLTALHAGRIARLARDLPEPSPFSHEILNANPYAFLDDAPLEERRSRAVSVRRGLPAAMADNLGALSDEAIAQIVDEARPTPRGPDELHDLLLDLGAVPESEGQARGWETFFDALVADRRAARIDGDLPTMWVAAERRSLAAMVWPEARFVPDVIEPPARKSPAWTDRDTALAEMVRGRLAISGPTTAAALAVGFAVADSDVEAALARVEMSGAAMRGAFTAAVVGLPAGLQWCDRVILARIHRRTLDRLRREIEPVSAADLMRFLLSWQHLRPSTQLHGREGLREIVAQLQGFEAAAGAWEREILPARLSEYDPAWLDDLCLAGELTWGRLAARPDGTAIPSRASAIGLCERRSLSWLLAPRDGITDEELSDKAREVLEHLQRCGASFTEDILGGVRRLRVEVEEGLWELVAAGRITCDGFSGLRALLPAAPHRGGGGARHRFYSRFTKRHAPRSGAGRWALLSAPTPPTEDDRLEALARQLLRRYGVVFRDVLARENHAPPWWELLRVYRRLEMRGEIRGGRLIAGFVGEQFALPEAVEALRAMRRQPPSGETVRLSACDPLNLVGIITPGPRVPATLANTVAFRDGVPTSTDALFTGALNAIDTSTTDLGDDLGYPPLPS